MSFEQFLVEQEEKCKKDKTNAAKTIAKYRVLVSEFYQKIKNEWLSDAINRKQITLETSTQTITEERLGVYNIDCLSIVIAEKKVIVKPVGTVLIGTDARLDLCYGHRECMIIHDKDDGSWKQVVRTQDRISHKKLTADVFQKIIMDLMR